MLGISNFAYALRTLRKSPGFTLAVVSSLALGVGANAAMFSVINGLLLHPAGLSRPAELVAPRVNYQKLGLNKVSMSATDYADVRGQHQVFSGAALEDLEGFNYTSGDSPERVEGALVSWQWFKVLGVTPLLGRGFHPEEDQPGSNHVAVLSFSAWQRLFAGDRGILQRNIELNKTPYRVIGVMPRDFRWPAEADVWMPIGLPMQAYGPGNRFNENYFAVARLAPGVSYARAASVMQRLTKGVLDQIPFARGSQWSMVIEPLTEYTAGDLKTPMFILLGAVAFVLVDCLLEYRGADAGQSYRPRAGTNHPCRARRKPGASALSGSRRDADSCRARNRVRLRSSLRNAGCAVVARTPSDCIRPGDSD